MSRHSLALVVLAVGCLTASAADAQTVNEILAANLTAKGGVETLRAVQSVRQTMTVAMPGADAIVVVHSQRPNLLRQELTVGGETFVHGFDGRVAWERTSLMSSGAPTMLTGPKADALRAQAAFDGLLAEARAAGHLIDLLGRPTIGGREVYHLRIAGGDQVWHCYLDVETALETRIVQDTGAGRFQQDLSDYREVGGIRVPFRITTYFNGEPQSLVVVTDVVLNAPIDARLFQPGSPSGAGGAGGAGGQILN